MSEQVPEATNENEVQMLHAEMDAHCKIADLCFAAGAETDDGTSVGAVRGLVKLLAQAQASLAAAHEDLLVEKSHQQHTAEHVAEIARSAFQVLGALFGTHSPIPRISNWFWEVWQRHEPGELFPLTEEETNCVDKYCAAARAQALDGLALLIIGRCAQVAREQQALGATDIAYEIMQVRHECPSDSTALAKLLAEEQTRTIMRFRKMLDRIGIHGYYNEMQKEFGDDDEAARVAELKGEQP